MHSPRPLALFSSFLLLVPVAKAAGKKEQPARPLASTKLEFRLNGPESQRLEDAEAEAAFKAIEAGAQSKADKKNAEEYRFQHESLVARGFEAARSL